MAKSGARAWESFFQKFDGDLFREDCWGGSQQVGSRKRGGSSKDGSPIRGSTRRTGGQKKMKPFKSTYDEVIAGRSSAGSRSRSGVGTTRHGGSPQAVAGTTVSRLAAAVRLRRHVGGPGAYRVTRVEALLARSRWQGDTAEVAC
jgi:hypothetical protein